MDDTTRRLLDAFEAAARAHEVRGGACPEGRDEADREYLRARIDLHNWLAFGAPARLAPAAPELLAACKRALPCLEFAVELAVQGDQELRNHCVANHSVLVAMRAAIAKAEGAQP